MEDNPSLPLYVEGRIRNIRFGISTAEEIISDPCTSSISGSAISHPSQLSNPFLGLPLESGKCESCGTSEAGKCEVEAHLVLAVLEVLEDQEGKGFTDCLVLKFRRIIVLYIL
ncbi:hypothetical protein ACLOJK_000892 [Asimina triloba]